MREDTECTPHAKLGFIKYVYQWMWGQPAVTKPRVHAAKLHSCVVTDSRYWLHCSNLCWHSLCLRRGSWWKDGSCLQPEKCQSPSPTMLIMHFLILKLCESVIFNRLELHACHWWIVWQVFNPLSQSIWGVIPMDASSLPPPPQKSDVDKAVI